MKLVVKLLKVVLSLGLVYLAGEFYGKSVAEACLEFKPQK